MRRITSVKSQEELQSDIFCLKRQISLIVDENQLLKVKIRRLENESRRKDRYIETVRSDPQNDREVRRFLYDKGASMIYKLQKRNEELEDMLLQRDLQNAKRFNDIKTMCIYGHVDYKPGRRGSKPSVSNVTRSGIKGKTSQNTIEKLNSSHQLSGNKPNRMRSSRSLQSENSTRNTKNRYSISNTGDCPRSGHRTEQEIESANNLAILQSEILADKRVIRSKNTEIARLSAELREIKNRLRRQEAPKVTKSTSTTQLQDRRSHPDHPRTNYIAENKRNLSRIRGRRSERKSSPKSEERKIDKKLPTVHEQNEEATNSSSRTSTNIPNSKKATEAKRPKTRIEYVYDSEVSSDGEEFCLPNTLRSFLQQAVKTVSTGRDHVVVSD